MNERFEKTNETGVSWLYWILCTLAVILGSRINIVVLTDDFFVAIGAIVLVVTFFLFDQMPFIPVVLASASGIYISRIIVSRLTDGVWMTEAYYPDFLFYLLFGFIFWLIYRKHREIPDSPWKLIPLVCVDFGSNFMTLCLMLGSSAFSLYNILVILMIAVVRAGIVWVLLYAVAGHTLIRNELLENYEKVTVLASQLEAEAFWMRENSNQIEDIVQSAYNLYDEMLQEETEPEESEKVLQIATGVHEVKKGYAVILRGMNEVLSENDGSQMTVGEILSLMEHTIERECAAVNKVLQLTKTIENDVRISDSHGLISVLSNLMTNAMEAETGPVVRIHVSAGLMEDGFLKISVTNDGPEIPEERLEYIFVPGFSTKVNSDTGATSRGMGLALTKRLIENQYQGECLVESGGGQTTFTVTVAPEHLVNL